MSERIEVAGVADAVAERGSAAYLLSVKSGMPVVPHVVSVAVTVSDGNLVVGAGRTTSANVTVNPSVTLLWPLSEAFPDHSLVVDGTAEVDPGGATITIRPTGAILHVSTPSSPDRRC